MSLFFRKKERASIHSLCLTVMLLVSFARKCRITEGKGVAFVIPKIPKSFDEFLNYFESNPITMQNSGTLLKCPCRTCTAMFKQGLVIQEEIFPSAGSNFAEYCRTKKHISQVSFGVQVRVSSKSLD